MTFIRVDMENLQGDERDDDFFNTWLEHKMANVFNCNKSTTFSFRSIILFTQSTHICGLYAAVEITIIYFGLSGFSLSFTFNLNLLLRCSASQSSCNWPELWHVVARCGSNGNVERSRKRNVLVPGYRYKLFSLAELLAQYLNIEFGYDIQITIYTK